MLDCFSKIHAVNREINYTVGATRSIPENPVRNIYFGMTDWRRNFISCHCGNNDSAVEVLNMLFADNMSCTSVPCDCMFFNILETGKLSDSVNAYPRLLGMQFVNLVSFQTLTGIFWFAPSYIVHLPHTDPLPQPDKGYCRTTALLSPT